MCSPYRNMRRLVCCSRSALSTSKEEKYHMYKETCLIATSLSPNRVFWLAEVAYADVSVVQCQPNLYVTSFRSACIDK